MDPAKLTVVKLRAELAKRGLDQKGNKPVLVDRLKAALDEEKADPAKAPVEAKESESEDEETVAKRTTRRGRRSTSREPPAPTPPKTRRSSSRSSRQSPARTSETSSDAAPKLEAISEEDGKTQSPQKTPTKTPEAKSTESPVVMKTPQINLTPMKDPVCQIKKVVVEPEKKETSPQKSPEKPVQAVQKTPTKPAQTVQKTPEKPAQKTPEKTASTPVSSPKVVPKTPENPASLAQKSPEKPVPAPAQSPKVVLKTPEKSVASTVQSPKVELKTPEKLATAPAQSPRALQKSPDKPAPVVQDTPEKPATPSSQKSPSPQKRASSPLKSSPSPTKAPKLESVASPQKQLHSVTEAEQYVEEDEPVLIEKRTPEALRRSAAQMVQDSPEQKPRAPSPQKSPEISDKMEDDEDDVVECTVSNDTLEKMDFEDEEKILQEKRKRTPSPGVQQPEQPPPAAKPEDEPELDESSVLLSWHDSDLHLVIDKTSFLSGKPLEGDGFCYMWASARASHGFNKGKVFYEIKINELISTKYQEDEKPNVLRAGWSTANASLILGKDKLSYCFDSLGKKCSDNESEDYGKPLNKDEILGCYADFSAPNEVILTYTVNGEKFDAAFTIPKEDLENETLFPHVASKNCQFSVNFGQEDAWSSETLEGYQLLSKTDPSDRVVGPRRSEKREDCEAVLLCGLPGCGKTTWATKYLEENKDKRYDVLSTYTLMERMNVNGQPVKETFQGRLEQASRALNKLIDLAPSRRRNYIIEQYSNVYPSSHKRKARNFTGFQRKGVVVVPSEEEYAQRIAKRREAVDGESIRDTSILEMKASFSAPVKGDLFEEVLWVELQEEEAKKLMEKYNTEGKSAGFGNNQNQHKRGRYDQNNKNNFQRNQNSWRGSPGGGWRDRRGGSNRGYQGGSNWRGRGGSPSVHSRLGDRSGQNDKRFGNDRRQSRGYSGYQAQPGAWAGNAWQGQSQSWGGGQAGVWASQNQQFTGSNWKSFTGGQNNYYGQNSYGNGTWGNQGQWNQQYGYGQQYWNQGDQGSSNQAVNKKKPNH